MSEARDALYSRESHPHTGDLRVDPQARPDIKVPDVQLPRRKLGGGNRSGIMTGPGFFNPISGQNVSENPQKRKDTWYTAHPGDTYRTGRFGSDVGSHAGTIQVDTPIRVISKSKSTNGIISVWAEFKVGEEIRSGWFNMDEIRAISLKKK